MLESDNLESQLEIVMTLFAHLGGMRWAGSESGMVCPAIFSWKCVKIEKDQSICFEPSLEPDQAQNQKIQKEMHYYKIQTVIVTFIRCCARANSSSSNSPSASVSASLNKVKMAIWFGGSFHIVLLFDNPDFVRDVLVFTIYEFTSMQSSHLQILPNMLLVSLDLSNSSLATLPRHLLFQIKLRYESSIFILPPCLGISVT